jgi:hypothetical protein
MPAIAAQQGSAEIDRGKEGRHESIYSSCSKGKKGSARNKESDRPAPPPSRRRQGKALAAAGCSLEAVGMGAVDGVGISGSETSKP